MPVAYRTATFSKNASVCLNKGFLLRFTNDVVEVGRVDKPERDHVVPSMSIPREGQRYIVATVFRLVRASSVSERQAPNRAASFHNLGLEERSAAFAVKTLEPIAIEKPITIEVRNILFRAFAPLHISKGFL